MTEPNVPPHGDNPFKKEDTSGTGENPYHQESSYNQDNPYQRATPPVNPGYPHAPVQPPAQDFQQGYPQQQAYQNTPYQGQPPYGYAPIVNPEGKSKADYSMVFGLIGLVFFSLIFGILALVYAKKAEELGADAKVGKILGWVDLGLTVLGFFWFLLLFVPAMLAGASGY